MEQECIVVDVFMFTIIQGTDPMKYINNTGQTDVNGFNTLTKLNFCTASSHTRSMELTIQ